MLTRFALIAFGCLVHVASWAQAGSTLLDAPDLSPHIRQGFVTSAAPVPDRANAPRYSIREDVAETGSNIRRNIVTGSIPFDKRYDELTPEQQALFKSQYQRLGPHDEPPFPANGLGRVYRAISVAQNVLLVQGTVSVFVEVNPKGEPESVSVFEAPDPKIARAVASILMLEQYKPALCDGTPCRMGFPVRVALELR